MNNTNASNVKEVLQAFLNAYWLRPETALFRTLDVLAMESFCFEGPSLDVGCGDGTFSFLRAGGTFAPEFDVFLSVPTATTTKIAVTPPPPLPSPPVGVLDQYFKNVDVYNFFQGEKIVIESPPSYQIDVGFDHKQALLDRAGQLSLYKELRCGDANGVWPFADESFSTVFSNIFYWLGDEAGEPKHAFSELFRVLRPGGRCCLMLPNTTFLEKTFYTRYYDRFSENMNGMLDMIDRGRQTDNIKQVRSQEAWTRLIEESGLRVLENHQHLSATAMQIWDIGLRPIFPLLLKLCREVEPGRLLEIKEEWVALFSRLAMPIIENEALLTQGVEPTFHCFILEKA